MTDTKCGICDVNNGKYSCPKCNVSYCSVSCYRSEKHLQCSESFYQDWVEEELKNYEADPESRRKMLEILKQSQKSDSEESLDSDDNEIEPDLATRMSGVNLDDEEAIWKKLTAEEKKEFRKLVASGNIIKIVPEWEPWWKVKKRKTLIQDCQEEEECDWKILCPPVLSDIPQLSTLTKSEPSPTIPFMLVNILSSYAFTVRWFKGTHKDLAVEAISTCIALSATLRENKLFNNCVEAFSTFEDNLSKCEWAKEAEYDKNVIGEDLIDITTVSDVNDPFFCVKAALSDLESLASQALDILHEPKNQQLRRFSGAPPKASSLKLILKKMIFYLSWTVEHGSLLTASLASFLH